jgi:hypothetical protein
MFDFINNFRHNFRIDNSYSSGGFLMGIYGSNKKFFVSTLCCYVRVLFMLDNYFYNPFD